MSLCFFLSVSHVVVVVVVVVGLYLRRVRPPRPLTQLWVGQRPPPQRLLLMRLGQPLPEIGHTQSSEWQTTVTITFDETFDELKTLLPFKLSFVEFELFSA